MEGGLEGHGGGAEVGWGDLVAGEGRGRQSGAPRELGWCGGEGSLGDLLDGAEHGARPPC